MTLEDHETREDIINPYITLFARSEKAGWSSWVALNTQTFAPAQSELIRIHDEGNYIEHAFNGNAKLYKAVATVAKYNTNNNTIRVDGASDSNALIPLGYLLEDVVKKLFPRTFETHKTHPIKVD